MRNTPENLRRSGNRCHQDTTHLSNRYWKLERVTYARLRLYAAKYHYAPGS